mmetsp:Transcript_27881/g.81960  ORF Transcript_27881/g.81960 Transcript_27881/m.81960 type:complete len:387 (+) Transcript_27881:161-1321(+)
MAMVDAALRRAAGSGASGAHDVAARSSDIVRIPVREARIGTWTVAAKHPQHVTFEANGHERKLRVNILHVGIVRRLELDADDIANIIVGASHEQGTDEGAQLVVQCLAPPSFAKEVDMGPGGGSSKRPGAASAFAPASDFTSGQASTVDTHVYRFARGTLEPWLERLHAMGLPFDDADSSLHAHLASAAAEAAAAAAARRPRAYVPRALNTTAVTSSPRVQAVALMEQLEREISDRQARYSGICPVRAQIYARAFDELVGVIRADETKRGLLLDRVRAEAQLTLSAYRSVFEQSTDFGARKLSRAVDLKGGLEQRIDQLEAEIEALRLEVEKRQSAVETLEFRAADDAKRSEAKRKDVQELEQSNAMLEQLLDVLKQSAPSKDKDK